VNMVSKFAFVAGIMLSAGAVAGYYFRNWLQEREIVRKLRDQARREIEKKREKDILVLKTVAVSIISVYLTLKASSFSRWIFKSDSDQSK
jgi:hypothetical protein